MVFAQAGAPPQQQGQQPPAGQPTAQQPPAGRGAGQGGQGGRQGGGRRGGFTQFTRELASQDVIVRGKGLYEANCASCHAVDLRGTADGKNPNLLRSGVALVDKHGELVGESVAKHTPKLTLIESDVVAIAEYIHSVHATMGGQGSPPGRNPTGVTLNVLVGDAASGEAYFKAACSSCHSITGDLKGIGSKYTDARDLQNAWVAGTSGRFGGGGGGGGGRGGGGGGQPVVVTMGNGTKIEGTLVRKDDWLVIVNLADGTRKSMARTADMKIDVTDRQAAHKKMVLELDDPTNKKMHDVTAYLWTVK
jgi:mono/diheme cytochrome c family protein